MELLYGIAFDLLLKLFLDKPAIQQPGPPPEPIVQALKVEAPQKIEIPEWVTNIPANGYVGISGFSRSIEEARQHALDSAVSQILQSMGAKYHLSHESRLEGNNSYTKHDLKEQLTYSAQWFVRAINENIKETDIQNANGKYLCFLLVNLPPEKIENLRRLSIGPMTGARIFQLTNDSLIVEVWENNDVEISLADFEIELIDRNKHAKVITMFFWKIPEKEVQKIKGTLEEKIVCKNSIARFAICYQPPEQNVKTFFYGSERQIKILLHGHDEIGRPLSFPVNSF